MDIFKEYEKYKEYKLDYWSASPIEWQQKNRDILNDCIRIYNEWCISMNSIDELVKAIIYTEDVLRNECGTYLEYIELMKSNINEILSNKLSECVV